MKYEFSEETGRAIILDGMGARTLPEDGELTLQRPKIINLKDHEIQTLVDRRKQDECEHAQGFHRGGLRTNSSDYPGSMINFVCPDCMTFRKYPEAYDENETDRCYLWMPTDKRPLDEVKQRDLEGILRQRALKRAWDELEKKRITDGVDQKCFLKKGGYMKKCHLCHVYNFCTGSQEIFSWVKEYLKNKEAKQ